MTSLLPRLTSRTASALLALSLGAATLAAIPAAHATGGSAAPRPGTYDIRVELDLEGFREGPAVFEVKGVKPGEGPELTADDLIENPSDWCGDLAVDVAPATRTLRVIGYEDNCDFSQVRVRVSSPTMGRLTLVTDTLMDVDDDAEVPVELSLTHGRGWAQAAWDTKSDSYDLTGQASFTWAKMASRTQVTKAKYAKKGKLTVRAKVAGDGARPKGTAKVVLLRGTKRIATKSVKVKSSGVVATTFSRQLAKGTYRVKVRYTGSATHTASTTARTFRVR